MNSSISEMSQSFLSLAVQRDLQLYVRYKLDERLYLTAWENEMLVLDALQPSVPSKYGLQSPNRTMLRLLIDKGVDLKQPRADLDGILAPSNIWDRIIKQTWPHLRMKRGKSSNLRSCTRYWNSARCPVILYIKIVITGHDSSSSNLKMRWLIPADLMLH